MTYTEYYVLKFNSYNMKQTLHIHLGNPTYIYECNNKCNICNDESLYMYIYSISSCRGCTESFNRYSGCNCKITIRNICIQCYIELHISTESHIYNSYYIDNNCFIKHTSVCTICNTVIHGMHRCCCNIH